MTSHQKHGRGSIHIVEALRPEPGHLEGEWSRSTVARILNVPVEERRPTKGRRAKVAVAAAVAAAVVPLGVSVMLPGGDLGAADSAAASALRQAAAAALQQKAEARPSGDQYVYVRSVESATYLYGPPDEDLPPFLYIESGVTQRWVAPDGSGRALYVDSRVTFPTPKDRAAWIAAGSPELSTSGDAETYEAGELSFLDLSGFPSEPNALLEIIEQRQIIGGPPGDWESFAIIGDLLRADYAPPAVRAGLYRLASRLNGVEYVGRVVDPAGRVGTAVGYTHNGLRHDLIFDPKTTDLLGERTIVVNAEEAYLPAAPDTILGQTGPVGTITYEVAYLDRTVTDHDTGRPVPGPNTDTNR